jgi:hypothetical protein
MDISMGIKPDKEIKKKKKEVDIMKERFIEIFKEKIKREGSEQLLDYLTNKTDFFIAPASTRHHSSFEGGLCQHSMNVYKSLKDLKPLHNSSEESMAVVGLLHDICKIFSYEKYDKNVKKDGKWVQEQCYKWNENKVSFGHGEESVYIINHFMKLTKEEAYAIRYHMGAFATDDIKYLSKVYSKYKLAFYLHMADMTSSYYLEER